MSGDLTLFASASFNAFSAGNAQGVIPLNTIPERAPDDVEFHYKNNDKLAANIRVAIPCQVVAFYPETQTADVQPLIQEKLINYQTGTVIWTPLPVLPDLPVAFYQGGNLVVTVPITVGDEVDILFQDLSIESWAVSGGIQQWVDRRRHDLSDGIVITGLNSQPNVISDISTTAIEMRTKDNSTKVSVADGIITTKVDDNTMVVNGEQINLTVPGGELATANITISPLLINMTADLININGTPFPA